MSAFSAYFSRLKMVVGQNYDPDEPAANLTNCGVSREYYSVIDERSDALLSFINKDANKRIICENCLRVLPVADWADDDILHLCLLMDLVRCFEGLNHPTKLDSCEGLALLNIMAKVYRPDYFMSFDELPEVPHFIINLDSLVGYIEGCIEETDIMKNQSIVSVLLQIVNPEADKKYCILLYKLCEAISEVDGVISISEREFLMNVLRLDDDDVTNDIITYSIFNRNE